MRLTCMLLMASIAYGWDCPNGLKKLSEKNGVVVCQLTIIEQGPAGAPGPQGAPGIGTIGPIGPAGPVYVPPKPAPINWIGWTPTGGVTATPSEDGSRILINCGKAQGLCGFTHALEGSMTLRVSPSFDPTWGSLWFGVVLSPGANPIGILNTFSQSAGWRGTPQNLQRVGDYWMRVKDGVVSYSSDAVLWYPQVSINGSEVFLGCVNGGAFWVEEIR